MTTETKSQFAKRINRAPSYITELIGHGRIVLTEDGKRVEVEASLQKIESTASHSRAGVAAHHETKRSKKSAKTTDSSADQPQLMSKTKRQRKSKADQPIDEHSRQFYERVLQGAKNNIKQIDFDMAFGRRFSVVEVRKEAQSIGNTVRAALERLVDTAAPRIALMPDRASQEALLRFEVAQLRRVIKAEFPRAFRRLKRNG